MQLHYMIKHTTTNFFYPNWSEKVEHEQFNDLTFKNACEGARAINMEFRYLQLSKILSEVLGTELSKAFNL